MPFELYGYHAVPKNMIGKKTVPLIKLKELDWESYRNEMEKFPNQFELTNQWIPTLRCRKNEVIFMTLIHPNELEKEHVRRVNKSLKGTCNWCEISHPMCRFKAGDKSSLIWRQI